MFPSPYGVSFILISRNLLRYFRILLHQFPSPYGVSFILITEIRDWKHKIGEEFPSPYGVSFILIEED